MIHFKKEIKTQTLQAEYKKLAEKKPRKENMKDNEEKRMKNRMIYTKE